MPMKEATVFFLLDRCDFNRTSACFDAFVSNYKVAVLISYAHTVFFPRVFPSNQHYAKTVFILM